MKPPPRIPVPSDNVSRASLMPTLAQASRHLALTSGLALAGVVVLLLAAAWVWSSPLRSTPSPQLVSAGLLTAIAALVAASAGAAWLLARGRYELAMVGDLPLQRTDEARDGLFGRSSQAEQQALIDGLQKRLGDLARGPAGHRCWWACLV